MIGQPNAFLCVRAVQIRPVALIAVMNLHEVKVVSILFRLNGQNLGR